jgi:hypothetical protein
MTMQNHNALKAIDDLIEHYGRVVAVLEKARNLVRDGAVVPVADMPRGLPAVQNSPAKRTGRPGSQSLTFTQVIDGVSFSCTEQQHAFVEMLGEHDYVTTAMAVVLWDNKLAAFWAALKRLRGFMVQAGVPAAIATYPKQGYRLEAFAAAEVKT